MPNFNDNTPRDYGRQRGVFVPFSWHGYSFPQGVAPDLVGWFGIVLDNVVPYISGGLHPGGPNVAGTWGGEVRANVNNPSQDSFHAYGQAIDINAPWNGNNTGPGGSGPFEVPSRVASIVRSLGGLHGGEWGDPMHIECHLTAAEMPAWYAAHGHPSPTPPHPAPVSSFPLPSGYYFGPLSGPEQSISGMAPSGSDTRYRPYIAQIQGKLHISADGLYGPGTIAAVTAFQRSHGLAVDGETGPNTWKALGL